MDEVSDPPLRTEMNDDWTGITGPDPQPRADPAGLVRRGRRRPDDDLGQLPGRGPERRARRDQRPPLGLLPDRASRRLHHRPRVRAGPGRHPVGAADRRPARSDRTELGQGLDHRGQPHPRRQMLGDLDRQGGLHRPQLRHRAPGQARLPVPAGVGVRRPPDRLGPRARRLAHHPPQHHLRLRPERHRRSPRLRVLHHRGQPHLQHRDQARVLRLRDRRHQAARRDRRHHPPQPHPRLHARHLAGLADPRHSGVAEPATTATAATCSSRSATAPTSSSTTSSHHRPRWSCSARAARSSTTSSAAPSRSNPSSTGPLRTTCRTAPRSPATRPSTAATTATSATSSSAETPPGLRADVAQPGSDAGYGTAGYNGHPASMEEYLRARGRPDPRRPRALRRRQAAGLHPRQRLRRAEPSRSRPRRAPSSSPAATSPPRSSTTATRSTSNAAARGVRQRPRRRRHRADLERVRFVDADFEEPDGTRGAGHRPARRRQDRGRTYPAGPITALGSGTSRIRVW